VSLNVRRKGAARLRDVPLTDGLGVTAGRLQKPGKRLNLATQDHDLRASVSQPASKNDNCHQETLRCAEVR
jgi:hypothetical protein